MTTRWKQFLLATAVATGTIGATLAAPTPAQAVTTTKNSCVRGADAAHYQCSFSGTTTDISPVNPTLTLPLSGTTPGITFPIGTTNLANGAGTMQITKTSIIMTFSQAFFQQYTSPYTYQAQMTVLVDNYTYPGPFSVTVNGSTSTFTPGGYCDTTCQSQVPVGASKSAYEYNDGSGIPTIASRAILGSALVKVGTPFTITDKIGAGQYGCTAKLQSAAGGGNWNTIQTIPGTYSSGDTISATYTPTSKNAYAVRVQCRVDGTQTTYGDVATINGQNYSASSTVSSASGGGSGANPVLSMTKVVKNTHDVNTNGFTDAGDTVDYMFVVRNSTGHPLAPVTINDPSLGVNFTCAASLAVDAIASCSAPVSKVLTQVEANAGKFTNTATATGQPTDGVPTYTSSPSSTTTTVAPTGSIQITKRDARTKQPLTDAAFRIYQVTANTWTAQKMTPSTSVCDAMDQAATPVRTTFGVDTTGHVNVDTLQLSNYDYQTYAYKTSGTYNVYCLVEVKTPKSHALLARPIPFVLSSSTPLAINVDNPANNLDNALPQTGGNGIPTAWPWLLLASGAVVTVVSHRHRGSRMS